MNILNLFRKKYDKEETEYWQKFMSCKCDDAPKGHLHTDLEGAQLMPKEIMFRTRSEWEFIVKPQ